MSRGTEDRKWYSLADRYTGGIRKDIWNLGKWIVLASLTGVVVGSVSIAFAKILAAVTGFREGNPRIFLGLPLAGLLIVFLYQKFGRFDGGVNQVFSTVKARDNVRFWSAPLIFVSTVLTHLTGGSAGREGAALQLGGSIGNQLGKWLPVDEEDRQVMVMCGMSAAFAALFGTPMAAALFSIEVIHVGTMYYGALAPCVTAALTAAGLAARMGVHAESFQVMEVPVFTFEMGCRLCVLAVLCAAVSILFCILLEGIGKAYKRWLKNPYVRVAAGAVLIMAVTFVLKTDDYKGAGAGLIIRAVEHGEAEPTAFFWKMLLTALTIKAGFKGGEIVPAFCIGATFGCVIGPLLGIPASFAAACGMTAVFCGVTNCPVASALIAFEMFGFEGASSYLLTVVISYAASGYYSLYKEQVIVYSKYKAKRIHDSAERLKER